MPTHTDKVNKAAVVGSLRNSVERDVLEEARL